MVYRVSLFSEITREIIFFVFVVLVFVSRVSHRNTKISFVISQEVSLNALASLRSRFFTLRVQNKVNGATNYSGRNVLSSLAISWNHTLNKFCGFVSLVCDFVSHIIHLTTIKACRKSVTVVVGEIESVLLYICCL